MLLLNENRFKDVQERDIDSFVTIHRGILDKAPISIAQNASAIKGVSGANNFTSMAVYWWPDPESPTGYPYIRRDGSRNPETYLSSDGKILADFINSVSACALLYRLSGVEDYSAKAVELIRAFLIEESTRMNPHMTYSGVLMGDGPNNLIIRGAVIDSDRLPIVVDMISILRGSPSWTQADEDGTREWFNSMADWFLGSPRAIIQAGYYHNIKTSYMTQLMSYLCAAGREQEAVAYMSSNVKDVLGRQIDPDGQQPLELDRVAKKHYCTFNLSLLCNLAKVCSSLGMDIWDYSDEQGRGSIRQAMRYMSEIYIDPSKWTLTSEGNNSATTRAWLESGCSVYGDQVMQEAFKSVKIHNFLNVFAHVFVADRKTA